MRVYKVLLKLSFSYLTAYRSNFVNNILSAIAWGLFTVFSIVLLTSRTSTVFGWTREEILLLTASYAILTGFFHTFLSPNFERLSQLAHFGQLDRILLYPIDSQFSVSLWQINYTRLVRLLIGLGLYVVLFHPTHISLSMGRFGAFLLLFFVGLTLQYTIWFLVATTTIWFTRLTNLVELMYSITGMARYPQEMFRQLASYIFVFLLPITLIIITPVKVLIQKVTQIDVVSLLLVTAALFGLSRAFWKFSLRYYTSASS